MAQNNKGHARPGTGHDTANVSGTPRVEGLEAGIQLPSGGGALRGMGERFQANGFTGTGALHIPVPSTQSRSLSANLSLDYSSTGGQGIAGMGFALSRSASSRRTTHGVPKYDDTDVFVLDDNVLVADVGGATRLSLGSADYDVLRFRPRQEDHGLRIERWTCSMAPGHPSGASSSTTAPCVISAWTTLAALSIRLIRVVFIRGANSSR